MSLYREQNCIELNKTYLNKKCKIAGWIRKKRDHGPILFIDLVDASGIVQCVIEKDSKLFKEIEKLNLETVVSIEGLVIEREEKTQNLEIASGEIEVKIENCVVLGAAEVLPFPIHQQDLGEESKLKYRFLYLRRKEMQDLLKLRVQVLDFLRAKMKALGFQEVQTPILTASSPEGARDYLVPSRLHPGKFYALPQAPQQFKQILMASGVEKYFQIAPCFRDEDGRADRLIGEFYQLDFEMAFATQEDIFKVLEDVLYNLFKTIRPNAKINKDFPKISYKEAMEKYGSDKPDLRNPLELLDITDEIETPKIFKELISDGGRLIAIAAPGCATSTRKFFDDLQEFMKLHGSKGLAYATKSEKWQGPLAAMIPDSVKDKILKSNKKIEDCDTIFLVAAKKEEVYKLAGILRQELGNRLHLIMQNEYNFCLIVDFPMFEKITDEKGERWEFMHNPFSMPQGNLDTEKIGEILSYQYDIVCNGYELSSGAVRNHERELVKKVFAVAGYKWEEVEEKFGVFKAFKYGVPPHAGSAPGIDRIIMLLSNATSVRDIVAFPLNQNGEDILMNAPSEVDETMLARDLHLKLIKEKI